jgi:hypothetical protein
LADLKKKMEGGEAAAADDANRNNFIKALISRLFTVT